jgi:two-component system cell cycle sensor histidine kinase PleC
MSHELRTPLNAVIGLSESLESGIFGALTARQKAYLRDIHSAGKHLLGLINDILDISKVEAGRIELRQDWVDLHGVIRDCLRLVKARARGGEISANAKPI